MYSDFGDTLYTLPNNILNRGTPDFHVFTTAQNPFIMHTCKAIVFTLIAVFTLQFGFANNIIAEDARPDMLLVQTESVVDYTLDLRLINITTEKVVVRVKDAAGECIYFDKIKDRKDYGRRFLLHTLPDGAYSLSVENATDVEISKPFTLQAGTVSISTEEEYFPLRKEIEGISIEARPFAGKMLPLSCKNETDRKVTLRVRDLAGNTIFTTKLRAGETCQKQISLDKLPEGSFKISIDGNIERLLTVRDGKAYIENKTPRA